MNVTGYRIHQWGGPLRWDVFDVQPPGAGEVMVRVEACGIGLTVLNCIRGDLTNDSARLPRVPGHEIVGVVDAVGPGTSWRVGDRVMAIVNPRRPGGGAQAELVVVPAASVARVPEGTSLEAAATLPMNGLTVRLAFDQLALTRGQTLGVTGAAGAVGAYAVELGVNEGLRVIAVGRAHDEALVKRLGAETFIPSGDNAMRAVYDAARGGVDGMVDAAVLDAAVLPAIRDGGKLATVRGWSGPSERSITILPVRVTSYVENGDALGRLGRLVAEKRLTLRVAETFPPERTADAQQKLAAGGTRGRLVIVF
jgi:NADPH:quinone reductase-like Zn-dependent oxidoreductase